MAKDPRIETGSRPRQLPPEAHIRMHFEKFSSFVEEYSSMLSLGGMFVVTRNPRPVGSEVAFDLKLADGFRLFHGHGTVAWVRLQEGGRERPPGMALRFIALDEKGRELVLKVLEEQVKAGGQPFEVDPPPADAVLDYAGLPVAAPAAPPAELGEEPTLVTRRRSLDETGFDAPWGQKLPEVPIDLLEENESAPSVPSVSEVQFAPIKASAPPPARPPASPRPAASTTGSQTGLFDAAFPARGESPVDFGFDFEESAPPAPTPAPAAPSGQQGGAAGFAFGGRGFDDATIGGHEDPLVDFDAAPGDLPFEPDPEDYAVSFDSEEPTMVGSKPAAGAKSPAVAVHPPASQRQGTLASDGFSLLPAPGVYQASPPPEPWKAPAVPEWEVLGPENAPSAAAPADPFAAPADPFAAPADPFAAPADPFAAPADPFAASAAPAPAARATAPFDPFAAPAGPLDPFSPEGLFSKPEAYAPAPAAPFAPAAPYASADPFAAPADPFAAPADPFAPAGDAFSTSPAGLDPLPPRGMTPPSPVEAYTPFDLGRSGSDLTDAAEGFGLGAPSSLPPSPFPPPGYPASSPFPPPAPAGASFPAGYFAGSPADGGEAPEGPEGEDWPYEEEPPTKAARLKAALLSRKAILGLAATAVLVTGAYFLAGDFLGGGGSEAPIAGGPPDGGGPLPRRSAPADAGAAAAGPADGAARDSAAAPATSTPEPGPAGSEPERVVAQPDPAPADSAPAAPAPLPPAAREPVSEPASEPASEPVRRPAPAAARLSNAQYLVRIDVQKSSGRTVVELTFDGELDPSAVVHQPLGYRSSDGLGKDQLILAGILGSHAANRKVGSPELAGIRTGQHPGELRVVFDLPPGARISNVTPEGKSVKVLLER